jgi:hypothetical protein
LVAGHGCPFDQDGDHADVAFQRGVDLHPDDVVGVVEPPTAVLVGGADPVWADDCQQHLAGADRLGDDFGEVDAERDGVDVHEDLVVTESVGEPVVQPTGQAAGFLPPVADEDATGSGSRHPWRTSSWAAGVILSGPRAPIETHDTRPQAPNGTRLPGYQGPLWVHSEFTAGSRGTTLGGNQVRLRLPPEAAWTAGPPEDAMCRDLLRLRHG